MIQSVVAQILDESKRDETLLVTKLEELAGQVGNIVYQEILRQLMGKSFPAELAEHYWREALDRRADRCQESCVNSGVRSSLLGYLYQVVGEMRDPRIIEAEDLADFQHASVTDGLTGLYHQTYFKAHLEQLVERMQGHNNQGMAVVMLDLDHFKQYNDRCSHMAGDEALRQVAEMMLACIRQGDLAARYGGEEFSLILHRLNLPQACMVVERIRRAIASFPFPGEELLDRGTLTISGGIAMFPEDGNSAAELLARADKRLYQAKQCRNAIFPLNRDKRRARRHPLQSIVEYSVGDDQTLRTGLSRDLSASGMTLACEEAPPPGTKVQLHFRKPFWPVDCKATAVVCNTSLSRDGLLQRVGVKFKKLPDMLNGLLFEKP